MSSENAYKTCVKSTFLIDFRGRLTEIGPTKFEAKRPRAEPLSQGNRTIKTPMAMARARPRISHALGRWQGVFRRRCATALTNAVVEVVSNGAGPVLQLVPEGGVGYHP